MKFIKNKLVFTIARAVAMSAMTLAFLIHFYFLFLAKYSFAESTSSLSLLSMKNNHAETQMEQLLRQKQEMHTASTQTYELFDQIQQSSSTEGDIREEFKKALFLMTQNEYASASSILRDIQGKLAE